MKIIDLRGIRNLSMVLVVVSMAGHLWAGVGVAAAPKSMVENTKATKLTAADRQKIQHVISLQIKAFERDDETLAFSYSTPGLRKYFGTSRTFMEMVRSSYSVLYMNISKEFLEAAVVEGLVIQPLRIVTQGGETLIALYTLERQHDKEWRIGGCELAPSTLQAT